MSRLFLNFLLFFSVVGATSAQNASTSVSANVLTKRVAVGEFGTMFLKVTNGDAVVPEKIAAQGLEVLASGSQSNFSIENGVQTFSTTYIYRFRGNTPGTYTIPEVELTVRGQPYKTSPVEVEIFRPDPAAEAANPTRDQFAKIELSNDEFYVNELVPFTITAYVRGRNSINQIVSPSLSHESFVIKPFRDVRTDGGELGNTYYSSAVIDSHLFSLKAGTHRLGPGKIGVRVMDTRGGGGFLSVFPRTVMKELATNSVEVKVKPLPNGAPASFTGGVGNFELSVSPSTTEVAVGDPISMDFVVTGVGNLQTMAAPKLSVPQTGIWKTYDPNKTLNDEDNSDGFREGRASFSQVIIPEARVDKIPAYELSYFDPSLGEYVTRRTDPIPITMTAAQSTVVTTTEVGDSDEPDEPLDVPKAAKPSPQYNDVLHIRTGPARWLADVRPGATGPLYTFVQVVFSLAFFTIIGIGAARWIGWFRSERAGSTPVLTFAQSLKRLPKAGATRREFYHSVSTSVMLWKSEHHDAPPKVNEIVERITDRCDTHLYGGKKNGAEIVSEAEAEEIRSILHRLPRK